MEPSDALSTLVQWDSPKPGVIVVKVFTNLPHLLLGSFRSSNLDVTTLSVGALTTQFILAQLHLHRSLPYSPTQIIPPWQKEGDGLKFYQVLMETLWESSAEEHHLSSPLPLSVLIVSSHSNRDASTQTKETLSFSLALRQLQEVTQTKVQLEWRLALKLEWFGDKMTNGPGWLSRWTPPSGRSSMRWVRPIQWGFFHGFSLLLPSPVLVPDVQWVKHSLPSPIQNFREPLPQHQSAAQHVESAHHLQFHLHWTSQQLALQPGNHSLHLPLVSSVRNGTAPLEAHLKVRGKRAHASIKGRQHQQWMQFSANPGVGQPQPQTTGAWAHQSPF